MQRQPNQSNTTLIFVPFVIENSGAWNAQAIKLTQEIGSVGAFSAKFFDDP